MSNGTDTLRFFQKQSLRNTVLYFSDLRPIHYRHFVSQKNVFETLFFKLEPVHYSHFVSPNSRFREKKCHGSQNVVL